MVTRIWQWAGAGLLCMGMSLATAAQGPGEGHGGHGPQDPNGTSLGSSPLNSRDEVRQTQPPRQGHYQDIPRRSGDNRHWQAGGPGQRPGGDWSGRPDGHGDGWGSGPHYRPGHTMDRFTDRYWKVPYRGQDYFYSEGYWYRPHGSGYVVVRPPYGVRVTSLPGYAQEMWIGGALFFLAADTYYQYLSDTGEYVVVNPQVPASSPAQGSANGYDLIAYPMYGQPGRQQDEDRYQCHRWAVDQSGFDPTAATHAPPPDIADTYRRALGACLSGRGYSVN